VTSLFKLLGVLLSIYVVWSVIRGEVFVKSGVWGKTLLRDESPGAFWMAIAIYILSAALFMVF